MVRPAHGLGADEFSGADKLRAIYSAEFRFTKDGLPIVPVARESDKARILEHVPEDRRAMVNPVLLDEAAALLRRYIDAGFGGFIFRNALLRTPEAVGLVGELIAMMRSEGARA